MKKLVSIFLSAVIICGLLLISACDRTEDVRKSDGKISVVTTIFPYYDFVRQLAGDKVDIRLLLSPGSDPHSYEPKPSDITAIENMREAELRTAISEWKGKYEETVEQLQANQKTIKDYKNKLEKNEEASGLVDKELKDSNMILGKTDVFGEGVTITLSNSEERDVKYRDLLELINELRYAGAEAISINDVRILSSTEIAQPDGVLMIINGQRVSSPYVIKAIGNQTYLSSTLSLKDSGYIDKTRAIGLNVKLETGKNIKILKYNGDMNIKYMKEGENK